MATADACGDTAAAIERSPNGMVTLEPGVQLAGRVCMGGSSDASPLHRITQQRPLSRLLGHRECHSRQDDPPTPALRGAT